MQENWNVAHWLETTSSSPVYLTANQNSFSPWDPTLAITSLVLARSEEIQWEIQLFMSFTPSTCVKCLCYVCSAFLLTSSCFQLAGKRDKLLDQVHLTAPTAQLNKHFWHFWPWVQRMERPLCWHRFESSRALSARWSLQSVLAWPPHFWNQSHFTPPPRALSPYPSRCTPVFLVEAFPVSGHIQNSGKAKFSCSLQFILFVCLFFKDCFNKIFSTETQTAVFSSKRFYRFCNSVIRLPECKTNKKKRP